jgi:hypothetical protein
MSGALVRYWVIACLAAASLSLGACVCRPQAQTPAPTSTYAVPKDYRFCDWSKPDLSDWCKYLGDGEPMAAAALISTPFLPWPPPRPAHYLPLRGKVPTNGTLGAVAERLAARLDKLGYEDLLYYEVDGGFAVTTALERFDETGQSVGGEKRFQRGKRGGYYGIPDLLKKVFVGEDGHYRIFVFIVSSEAFPIAEYTAEEADVRRWGREGSLYLAKSIASQPTEKTTTVTLLVYEFTEDKGRSSALMAIPRSISAQQHLHWLGFDR